jgi:transcriptional regulator with XRE-family HTH domain
MSDIRIRFGKRLKSLRLSMGMVQEEFAEVIGISVDFLSLIERGKNSPSFGNLERIAKALSISVKELFNFEE